MEKATRNYFNTLPTEVVEIILTETSCMDKSAIARTCSRFNNIIAKRGRSMNRVKVLTLTIRIIMDIGDNGRFCAICTLETNDPKNIRKPLKIKREFKLRNYLLYNLESLCFKENVSKVVVSFKKLTRFTRHLQELISTWPQIDSMEFGYDNRDTEQLGLPKFFKTMANRSNMVVIRTRASFKHLITTSDGNVIALKNKFSLHLRFDGNGEGCTIEDWTKFFAKNELKNVFFKSDETVPIGELIAFITFLIEVMKMDKIVKFHIQLNQMDYSWNQRDMLCVLTAENVDTLDHTNVYQDFEVRYTVTKNNGAIGIIGVELF